MLSTGQLRTRTRASAAALHADNNSRSPGTRLTGPRREYDRLAMAADTIDAYLATLPNDQRETLQRLRRHIARLLPDATETISYGMPAFKVGDRAVVWFAGWKGHCSIYPLTDTFLAEHADELKPYRRTKGSLHFTPDAPLPEGLVEDFVRARLVDLEATSR
jgi:uncharacterized protein YdhG (YjbR/CyaY superfamily)